MKKSQLKEIIKEEISKVLSENETYPKGWTDELEKKYQDAYHHYMDGYQGAKYYSREDILKQHSSTGTPSSKEEKRLKGWDMWQSGMSDYKPKD